MFIGREKELEQLNKTYKSDQFEFVVMYGRRRVGKTSLLSEFTKDKEAIYFVGIESNEKQNLENFSRRILETTHGLQANSTFLSFQDALESCFEAAKEKRLILVIDEYPYVARSSSSLASVLQNLIDRYKDSCKLMLILCGSSMSYMEDEVLAYKSPLYGRRTAQMKIEPFDFKQTCDYLQGFTMEEKAFLYGAVGGTPQYLLQVNPHESVEENIKNIFLNPTSFLYEEPMNLLKQEVREPAIYTAILTAIASGASRMSDISSKIGEDTNVCTNYIKNLIHLGIIKKEYPYGDNSSKKAIYSIEDNMFRFWYRFVLDNNSLILHGAADLVYKRIEPYFSEYMGKIFEDICIQYLWRQLLQGKLAIEFSSLGRWWGKDARNKCQAEIDIMGEQDKNTALFAECKWTHEKADKNVLETLVERSHLFRYQEVHYFVFSKSGFTQGCEELAATLPHISLITYQDLVSSLTS